MADLIKISDSVTSTSSVVAASSKAVKSAYDKAQDAISGLSVSGKTITYTKNNGTTGTITTQDTNTTYSAGTGISLSSNKFSIANSGVTAGSYGPSANATPNYGATFNVPYVTVDATGRVTAASTKTVKIPAAPSGGTASIVSSVISGMTGDADYITLKVGWIVGVKLGGIGAGHK